MSDTTPQYKAFLNSLGWTVDIVTHRGFNYGLDVRITGKQSIYFMHGEYEHR